MALRDGFDTGAALRPGGDDHGALTRMYDAGSWIQCR